MQTLVTILRAVHDPRDSNARHDLAEVLFTALIATLCGAKTCVEIAEFAEAHEEHLRDWLVLEHGVASHDTFSRLFRLLDPVELAKAFDAFMAGLRRALGLAPGRVIAVDGKALRRGYEAGRSCLPPLLVSVWDVETRATIAQARAPGGNEVAATLGLLKGLTLKGSVVTADALHCHPAMAEAVLATKAHYALGLKSNHGPLHAAAQAGFATHGATLPFSERNEEGHGRRERRRVDVLRAHLLPKPVRFPGLKAIGRIQAERTLASGKTQADTRYVALSKILTPPQLAETIRAHWSIENHLHWTLDVIFREDEARTRKDHGPENLAVIRRLAQNILRAHPLQKPMAHKMRRALWSKDFLIELFTHMR